MTIRITSPELLNRCWSIRQLGDLPDSGGNRCRTAGEVNFKKYNFSEILGPVRPEEGVQRFAAPPTCDSPKLTSTFEHPTEIRLSGSAKLVHPSSYYETHAKEKDAIKESRISLRFHFLTRGSY
ncbi:unnamed protein product [Nesidiocoris tenuis]|uniref:Uncharacterized protein n=1 Tax=Nesidiocoris tenuis TaxID=355587 RepID=A0A6H5G956_9HEMI|nr:unnamed protein product [Nesidiocoris tenuis]